MSGDSGVTEEALKEVVAETTRAKEDRTGVRSHKRCHPGFTKSFMFRLVQ